MNYKTIPWWFAVSLGIETFALPHSFFGQSQLSSQTVLANQNTVQRQLFQKVEHWDPLAPIKREQWFEQQRAFPKAHIPKGVYWYAQKQRELLLAKRRARLARLSPAFTSGVDPLSVATWTPDGPQPLNLDGGPVWSGAASSIAVDPTNPNIVYLGTSGGGVWKTIDGGQNWTPLTDNQASLAIGAVAVDPNNPSTIYAGTGGFAQVSYLTVGLLKSTDGGTTWTLIRTPYTTGGQVPGFNQIAVQPGNSNVIMAATNSGLYRSQDGGQTWAIVLYPVGYSTQIKSIMFDKKNPTVAYAGLAADNEPIVYKSTDAGATWNPISGTGSNSLPTQSWVANIALDEDATGSAIYAAIAAPPSNGDNDLQSPGFIYKTVDGGANWTDLGSPSQDSGEGCNSYTCAIAVDPANPSVLYTTGVNAYQSVDGGKTWQAIIQQSQIYADQHAFAFAADGSRLYLADDGGSFVSTDPAGNTPSFTSLNQTLNTMTFYPGFSISENPEAQLLVGAQDHGIDLYQGSLLWNEIGPCGDGGAVYMDTQGIYAYAHCPGTASWSVAAINSISTWNGWNEEDAGINPNGTDVNPWVADIKGDWQDPWIVYTGTDYLYQTMDFGQSWTQISPNLSPLGGTISTIAVSPSDSNTVFAGTNMGELSVTHSALSGALATWSALSGLPNASIAKILVAPDSPKDVYVTMSGFGTGHIFHSTDGGATWADISYNLPDMPVNSLVVDPDLANTIYLATDTGVYFSENGGGSWSVLGTGLPNVIVTDMLIDEPTRTLHVITYGRGAWETIVPLVGLQASVSELDFSSQNVGVSGATKTLALTNNQNSASLNLTGFQITGPFAQTNTCGTSMMAGASCSVSVSFNPKEGGSLQGVLTVSSSTNTVVVLLSGAGDAPELSLSPSSLNFGNQAVGTQSDLQNIVLANIGTAALNNISCSITGANAGDFIMESGCPDSMGTNSSSDAQVAFFPHTAGTRVAMLTISDNAPDSPQNIPLTGNGGGTAKTTPPVILSVFPLSITSNQSLDVNIKVGEMNGSPTATGSVVLSGGGFTSATTMLSGGATTINIPSNSLGNGTDTLIAAYTPDASGSATYNAASGSAFVVVTSPTKSTPSVTVIPSSATITTAQSLTVAIAVVNVSGNLTPTGNVVVTSGGYNSAPSALSGGKANIAIPAGALTAGTDTLEAVYTPDTISASAYNSGVGGAAVKVTPQKSTPALTLFVSANSIVVNQSLAITVEVSGGLNSPTPAGSITLSGGKYNSAVTSLSTGYATINIPANALSVGTYTFKASYTPDANSSSLYSSSTGVASTPLTVSGVVPTMTVTPGATSITTAQALIVTVTVNGGAGNPVPTGNVTLTGGSYVSAAVALNSGSATINIPADSLSVGSYTFKASYTPDANSSSLYSSSAGAASTPVTVSGAVPTMTVTPGATSITTAQALTVTVTVAGTPTPTGSVTVSSGSYTSAASALSNGKATINIPAGSLPVGTDTLTASYTPDSISSTTYSSATQAASVTVAAVPSFTLSASPTSMSVVQGNSATATITVTDAGGFSGTVAFAASGLPSGVTASFAAGSTAGTQVLTLAASTSAAITSSPATVTITGTSGSLTAATSIAATVIAPPFGPGTGGTTSLTVTPGATAGNTATVSVAGTSGFSGTVNLTCNVTTSMTGVNDMPTCSLNPASLTVNGTGTQTSTLTVNTTGATSAANGTRMLFWPSAGGTAFALIFFIALPKRRRNWLALVVLLAFAASISAVGCGGGSGSSGGGGGTGGGNPGTTPGTYTVTVTGTSSAISATVGTITLNVQ